MTPELQTKIIKANPILFRDYGRPITETCISWGLDVGDGWFDLLNDLCTDLSKMIQEQLKECNTQDISCRFCGCEKRFHYGSLTRSPKKCMKVSKVPERFIPYNTWKWKWGKNSKPVQGLETMIHGVRSAFVKKDLLSCHCEKFDFSVGVAVQVKEKFGELRVYMHNSSEQMEDRIDEATLLSLKTCETCGKPGKSYDDGWIRTLCVPCKEKRNAL